MPLVGLLVALPVAYGFQVCSFILSKEVSCFIAMSILIIITGGLHLDGLADSADGLFSYRSRERMLEIMRDSTLGTNGVTAIILLLIGKFLLLKNIPDQHIFCALLLCPVMSRMALTWHSAISPYARKEKGIGEYVNATGISHAAAATAVSAAVYICIILLIQTVTIKLVYLAASLYLSSIGTAIVFSVYVRKRLGGVTGDTIGATVELTELVCLLVFNILSRTELL